MEEQKDMVLEVENLNVKFVMEEETVEAVNNISLHIKKGETLGLVGETGAGKTTTALSIMRLVDSPPGVLECDKLEVCGQDVMGMSITELEHIRGGLVSMIFQDPMTSLNPVFTVGQQIAESLERHEHLNKNDAWKKAEDMLELVGIPRERAIEYPHQFSGGMKQRVIIAIALACSPQLLIADEPTTALDVTIQAQILRIIKTLTKESNTSVILITHDMGVVAEVADHVMVMYAGKSVEYGTAEDIFDHPKHPYTIGLLNSIPKLGSGQEEHLYTIEGTVPGLDEMPEGCRFCTRCQYATEQCRKMDPGMREVDGHMVRCFLYGKEGEN
mgnify:CR=1 FL=1